MIENGLLATKAKQGPRTSKTAAKADRTEKTATCLDKRLIRDRALSVSRVVRAG
jgi:hypothetical protein